MSPRLYESVTEFWAVAGDVYRADPVRHTVPLLICSRDVDVAAPDSGYLVLLTIEDVAVRRRQRWRPRTSAGCW